MHLLLESHPWLRTTLRAVSAGLLLLSIGLVVWSLWPSRMQHQALQFSDKNLAQVGFTPTQQAALDEYHLAQISLDWPETLRIGETGRITLSVEPDSGVASISTSQSLAIDARLDLLGLQFYPASEMRTSLPPGKLLRLFWQVSASHRGDYSGNAWLYIVFPAAGGAQSASGTPLPLSAQSINIKVVSLAGLDVNQARLLAVVGIAVSVLIMLIVVIKS